MQRLVFHYGKQKLLEFSAEDIDFAQQPEGLLLTASGEILFQDTPLVEVAINDGAPLQLMIEKSGATVLDQRFQMTFFTLEADQLAVLLQ